MNFIKTFFKTKRTKVWFIVTCCVLVLLLTINIAAMALQSLLGSVIGRDRPILGDGVQALFSAETSSKQDALEKAKEVNLRANQEGIVLLKNQNNALPLSKGTKVSVFGKNSTNIVYGGTGSGATDTSKAVTLYQSLTAAGLEYNKTLKAFYDDNSKSGSGRPESGSIDNVKQTMNTGETPIARYTGDLEITKANYSSYSVALVVISRVGGENSDVPRTTVNSKGVRAEGARENFDDHFLQLDQNEADLLKAVCEVGFEHVIVIVNSSNAMELGFLKNDTKYSDAKGYGYDYASHIDGALWIGGPGINGLTALGQVLVGDVNPSGRLVDTYSMDFKADPVWENFGNNLVFDTDSGTLAGNRYTINGKGGNAYEYGVEYEEGIYVGYRYFETRGFTDEQEWYDDNVVYPFGYGLSYTTFEWKIKNKTQLEASSLSKEKFDVEVEVTNTGSVAGKDVVELYVTAPYTANGIEKSHVTLCGFAKTPLLQPNETKTVIITVDPYSFASYDYSDANNNSFKGYEAERGNYVFHVSKNAHDWNNTDMAFTILQNEDLRYDKDPVTGYSVVNRYGEADDTLEKVLTRTDWTGTMPARPTAEENEADGVKYHAAFSDRTHNNPNADSITEMPTQAKTKPRTEDGKAEVNLRHLVGAKYEGEQWNARWKTLLDSIMVKDMLDLYTNGNFRSIAIDYIYKGETIESDGPGGFTNFMDPTLFQGVCSYASECVLGATWNVEILEEIGKAVGEESLQGKDGIPYSGWYAPGVNLHRSPFGGRNYEYFSEDGFLTAAMASHEVKGARSKGVTVYVKHFAVNDQETNRQGVAVWLTEQALREMYLKPFEMCVKEGGATGIMSSFNRIGTRWTGGDYRLLTEILRNEWGFNGTVITDFNTIPDFMDVKQAIYAGGDLDLASTPHTAWFNENSAADVTMLRRATKNILYCTVNSNAMNADIQGYAPAYWKIGLWVADAVIVVGFAIWGYLAISSAKKKENLTA